MTDHTENLNPVSDETNADEALYIEGEEIKDMAENNRVALEEFLNKKSSS